MQSVGLVDDHLPGCFRYAAPDVVTAVGVTGHPGHSGPTEAPRSLTAMIAIECPLVHRARLAVDDALVERCLRRLRRHRRDRPGPDRDASSSRPDRLGAGSAGPSPAEAPAPARRRGSAPRATTPITAIVVEPLVASMSAPPTSSPSGWSPSEIVRAVLPIRPRSASGEYAVRIVMYVTSTIDWATPARDRRRQQGRDLVGRRDHETAGSRSRSCRRAGSTRPAAALTRAVSSDPATVPTP